MSDPISIEVAVAAAEDFIRRMSVHGFEVDAKKRAREGAYDYALSLSGKTTDQYSASIDYGANTASITIRPR